MYGAFGAAGINVIVEKWLTTKEVSEETSIPVATLHQWHHRRIGPIAVKMGRHLRYSRADLYAWYEELKDAAVASRTTS
jgi:excisionase family DNA binding protein